MNHAPRKVAQPAPVDPPWIALECPACGCRACVILVRPPFDPLSDATLILGVLSAVLGFITSLAAIGLGVQALVRMRRESIEPSRQGYARAGLILGIIFTFFGWASLMLLRAIFPSAEVYEVLEELFALPWRLWGLLGR